MQAQRWKLRKIQKEIVELKDTVTSMKNAFEELISKHSPGKKISELEEMLIEISNTEMQRET